MVEKIRKCILVAYGLAVVLYFVNQIAFFNDKEFERAVRDTARYGYMSFSDKRDKPISGIIWKKDLEEIRIVSVDLREYHVENISDIRYFKNIHTFWLSYTSAYHGDTSVYEEEHLLDNIDVLKKFKNLSLIHLYHLKVNKDIEAMFPDVDVLIY